MYNFYIVKIGEYGHMSGSPLVGNFLPRVEGKQSSKVCILIAKIHNKKIERLKTGLSGPYGLKYKVNLYPFNIVNFENTLNGTWVMQERYDTMPYGDHRC